MWGRLHIKTTQILPFFCCIPLFQSFLSLYIPLSFANFSHSTKTICRSADHRCIFICIYFSWIFVCIKGHPSSDSGPSEENFMKRVQIQDDEEAKERERKNKKLCEQAVCELSSSQESSSTQSAKEILRRRLNRSGCNKMKSVFLDRKIMLLFRIGLRSCQILVIFVKCGR